MRSFDKSQMISERLPHCEGQADPPNVMRRAAKRMSSNIVKLSAIVVAERWALLYAFLMSYFPIKILTSGCLLLVSTM